MKEGSEELCTSRFGYLSLPFVVLQGHWVVSHNQQVEAKHSCGSCKGIVGVVDGQRVCHWVGQS